MTKIDKIFTAIIFVIILVIGLFFGAVFQQDKEALLDSQIENLTFKLNTQVDSTEYWKQRWHKQDTVLHKISDHKECAFEIKSIIGEIY